MKKYIKASTLFFALCIALPLSPTASWAKPLTLTYSNFFPPTHVQSRLAEAWCKEVGTRTEGRVQVQYFAGQTLTKAKQTYDAVVDGIADVGFSVFAYTRGKFPVIGAMDLPFGYPSGRVATAVINDLYKNFKPKELRETEVMYLHGHGPGFIHTRGKAVKTLEDLKGMKIRCTGLAAEAVKALGGTPVAIPMPESYQSLQKGVVDGCANPLEANKGWKIGEVLDYATVAYPAAYTTSFFVVMNKEKWNAISPKDQEIIRQINDEWAVRHGEAWDESDMAGIRFFMQNGNTVHGIDAKESERWKKAVSPVLNKYRDNLNKRGIDGDAVMEFIDRSLKKYSS